MTFNELKNNYEYKVTVRALKNEFPFIKEVDVKGYGGSPDDMINKYETYIFLDLDIDPFVFTQMYNLTIDPIVLRYLKRGEPYWSAYLSSFAKEGTNATWPIAKNIEELMEGIHKSPAIPKELKLDKTLNVGAYYADPSTLPDNMSSQKSY
jgi:hypothetical protein